MTLAHQEGDRTAATQCNLCGCTQFLPQGSRKGVRCVDCGSVERTRVAKLIMDSLALPRAGQRMLHLAPERGLSPMFRQILGDGYDPVDIDPSEYPWIDARYFDVTSDAATLESESYDIVMHSHVMEHVRCNVTAALFHLHRALRPDGFHIFGIPIVDGPYEESLERLPRDEATVRFGQHDHVRRFGIDHLADTLGMIFKLPDHYNLETEFDRSTLDLYNIPRYARSGWHQHNIIVLRKNDIKLMNACA